MLAIVATFEVFFKWNTVFISLKNFNNVFPTPGAHAEVYHLCMAEFQCIEIRLLAYLSTSQVIKEYYHRDVTMVNFR